MVKEFKNHSNGKLIEDILIFWKFKILNMNLIVKRVFIKANSPTIQAITGEIM